MKKICLLFVFAVTTIYVSATVILDSRGYLKKYDLPEIDSVVDKLNDDKYRYGNNQLTYLQGKSMRIMIAWLQEWNKNVDVEVFSFSPVAQRIKFIHGESQEDQTKRVNQEKKKFLRYGFAVYPEYQNSNISELLREGKIPFEVETKLENPGELIIKIRALVKAEEAEKGQGDKLKFYHITMSYLYDLDIQTKGDTEESVLAAIRYFEDDLEYHYSDQYKELCKHPRGLLNNNTKLFSRFQWRLFSISVERIKEVEYLKKELPTSIYDVFYKPTSPL